MKIGHCLAMTGILVTVIFAFRPAAATEELSVLIVDGQNNHDWKVTTPILKSFLEETGRYAVDVATSPSQNSPGQDWDSFQPGFSKYDVVLSNYNGQMWPESVNKSLQEYVSHGGALVIVHAANNAFPEWPEWNKMIGLGWRGADYGDRLTVKDDGQLVRTEKGKGPGSGHGSQHAFPVVVRDRQHPVTMGMPGEWMHTKDELYHGQRGPAQNVHVLVTAFSARNQRGTGAHEPMVWWVSYGRGRVFTTVMGHADYSMRCVGFQTVVSRGCEWAATGKVTLPIPGNFPTHDQFSVAGEPR